VLLRQSTDEYGHFIVTPRPAACAIKADPLWCLTEPIESVQKRRGPEARVRRRTSSRQYGGTGQERKAGSRMLCGRIQRCPTDKNAPA